MEKQIIEAIGEKNYKNFRCLKGKIIDKIWPEIRKAGESKCVNFVEFGF